MGTGEAQEKRRAHLPHRGEGNESANNDPPPLPYSTAEELDKTGKTMRQERERRRRYRRKKRRKGRETGTERPHGGPRSRLLAWGGDATPPEEEVDLLGFTPERAHLLLQGVYGDFLHHNYGSHLEGGIAGDAEWQRRWRRLAAQSDSYYATPSGAVGRRFTAILAAEWREVLNRSCNSKRPLVFAHVVLTKMLGVQRAREIRDRITRRMDLWERGYHAGLVGDARAEGAAQEGRAAS